MRGTSLIASEGSIDVFRLQEEDAVGAAVSVQADPKEPRPVNVGVVGVKSLKHEQGRKAVFPERRLLAVFLRKIDGSRTIGLFAKINNTD